jgi:hypothetical protein
VRANHRIMKALSRRYRFINDEIVCMPLIQGDWGYLISIIDLFVGGLRSIWNSQVRRALPRKQRTPSNHIRHLEQFSFLDSTGASQTTCPRDLHTSFESKIQTSTLVIMRTFSMYIQRSHIRVARPWRCASRHSAEERVHGRLRWEDPNVNPARTH